MTGKAAFFVLSILTGVISVTVGHANAQVLDRTVNPAAYAADDVSDQIPYGSMHVLAAPADTETVFAQPAGNIVYKSQGITSCLNLNPTSSEVTIFNVDFNTARASRYIEVNYSGQFSLSASTQLNRIFLSCRVLQGASSVPCSGIFANGYAMARRVMIPAIPAATPPIPATYAAVTNSGSYIGYVYVGSDGTIKPDTATTVEIIARILPSSGFTVDGTGTVCYSNLILRY